MYFTNKLQQFLISSFSLIAMDTHTHMDGY